LADFPFLPENPLCSAAIVVLEPQEKAEKYFEQQNRVSTTIRAG
jgi:hypothetical protein